MFAVQAFVDIREYFDDGVPTGLGASTLVGHLGDVCFPRCALDACDLFQAAEIVQDRFDLLCLPSF